MGRDGAVDECIVDLWLRLTRTVARQLPDFILLRRPRRRRVLAFNDLAPERALFPLLLVWETWMVWLYWLGRRRQVTVGSPGYRLHIVACHCVGHQEQRQRSLGAMRKVWTAFYRMDGYACRHLLHAVVDLAPEDVLAHHQLLRSLLGNRTHFLRGHHRQHQRRSWALSLWLQHADPRWCRSVLPADQACELLV